MAINMWPGTTKIRPASTAPKQLDRYIFIELIVLSVAGHPYSLGPYMFYPGFMCESPFALSKGQIITNAIKAIIP